MNRYSHYSLLAALLFLFLGPTLAQGQCAGRNYLDSLWAPQVTQDLLFGQAPGGDSLFLDIYEPQGDTASARPLVILLHGGSFVSGSRQDSDVVHFAKNLAARGYVAASAQYRLGIPLSLQVNKDSLLTAAVKAMHDAKAAIRWFRAEYANKGNPWRIDSSKIYVGGISAGAITALHVGYLKNLAQLAEITDTARFSSLGVEGQSGNAGFSSSVDGVINFCGALGRQEWMVAGDPPLISAHGTGDNTVVYGTGRPLASIPFLTDGLELDGSSSLNSYLLTLGVPTQLRTWFNTGHVPFGPCTNADWRAFLDDATCYMVTHLSNWVCQGSNADCGAPVTARLDSNLYDQQYVYNTDDNGCAPTVSRPEAENGFALYPQPAVGDLTVEYNAPHWRGALLDLNGRVLRRWSVTHQNTYTLRRAGLPAGVYLIRLEDIHGPQVRRVVWR